MAYVCPKCGSDIQATIELDADVNSENGLIEQATSGGSYRLYCAEDCGWKLEGFDVGKEGWPEPVTMEQLAKEPDPE
jgi:hypothetical protein